jgi:hypothetical protein
MRSKFSCIAAAIVLVGAMSSARAADPKKTSAKKKSGDSLNDFDKQMQWENNVMGPDDKRAELAKIARAQAITKAAAEKAAAEKAAAEKNPPKEEKKEAKGPASKNTAAVTLATPEDDNAGKSTKSKEQSARDREISPKLSTSEAATPPPPLKPADDKFIDKLLKGESGGKKKAAKNVDDSELNDLLAKEKPSAPAGKAGKSKGGDVVDSLLRSAEKAPDMPAPKVKAPEWAKVEPAPAPPPPRALPKPQPKKNDGIIHVVQGATSESKPPVASASSSSRRAPASDSFESRQTASLDSPRRSTTSTSRKASSASFSDPFSDDAPAPSRASTKKSPPPASADPFADDAPAPPPRSARSASSRTVASAPTRSQPVAKKEPATNSGGFDDPFADSPPRSKAKHPAETKRAAEPSTTRPAAGFKDPFSDNSAPASSRGRTPVVAMRDSSKSDVSASRRSTRESTATSSGGSRSGWGVLKKQR